MRVIDAIVLQGVIIAAAIGAGQTRLPLQARLHASVERDAHGSFTYRYTVENGRQSKLGVGRLLLDLDSPELGKALAPQPTLIGPRGWATSLVPDSTARWITAQPSASIGPARQLAGFALVSRHPPTISRFALAPSLAPEDTPVDPPGEDPGEEDRFQHEFELYVDTQSVKGPTLGPIATAPTSIDGLLSSLERQVQEARTLRWITSDAAVRTLRAKLATGRAAATHGELAAAANALRAVRGDVAGQLRAVLSSEAASLIDANVQSALQLTERSSSPRK